MVLAQTPAPAPAVPADFLANISPEMLAKMAPLPEIIPAPADPNALPLYGARTPGSAKSEIWSKQGDNVGVRNVTRPTLTPVLPDPAKATGAAVIVAPGGGFWRATRSPVSWRAAASRPSCSSTGWSERRSTKAKRGYSR